MISSTTSSMGTKVALGAGLVAGATLIGVGALTIFKSEVVAAIGKAILGGASYIGSSSLTGALQFVGSLVVGHPGVIVMGGVLTLATVLFLKVVGEKKREIGALKESLKVFNAAQDELIEDMVRKRSALNGVKFQLTDSQEHSESRIKALEEENKRLSNQMKILGLEKSIVEESLERMKAEKGSAIVGELDGRLESSQRSARAVIDSAKSKKYRMTPSKGSKGGDEATVTPLNAAKKEKQISDKYLESEMGKLGLKYSTPKELVDSILRVEEMIKEIQDAELHVFEDVNALKDIEKMAKLYKGISCYLQNRMKSMETYFFAELELQVLLKAGRRERARLNTEAD